eukprot:CAMPEP_0168333372 /NCGR_PEP_ID=MMETSP0213-20121227/9573_1 /TAXON_ID=151035 /ORGANISM="Euplotes harpa, Strain FSP1.4" /LENGTH=167 /DNA_ID=CAMNT_0008337693 /DNA_START=76 /DNA_END=579 /DNA_ORIENTATION=+
MKRKEDTRRISKKSNLFLKSKAAVGSLADINDIMDKSEAKRHLNYNIFPNKDVQKKIDYFMTPYNKSKPIQKHMNFDEESPTQIKPTKNMWNKISDLIFSKDKKDFRKTLLSINSNFYDKISKSMLSASGRKLNAEEIKTLAKNLICTQLFAASKAKPALKLQRSSS